MGDIAFEFGEKFVSDLQKKVDEKKDPKEVRLVYRTLDAASKLVQKRVEIANKVLRYYAVHLACVLVGRSIGIKEVESDLAKGIE